MTTKLVTKNTYWRVIGAMQQERRFRMRSGYKSLKTIVGGVRYRKEETKESYVGKEIGRGVYCKNYVTEGGWAS